MRVRFVGVLCVVFAFGCEERPERDVREAIKTIDPDEPAAEFSVKARNVILQYPPDKLIDILASLYNEQPDSRTRTQAMRAVWVLWTSAFPADLGGRVAALARQGLKDRDPRVVYSAAALLVLEDSADAKERLLKKALLTHDSDLLGDLLWLAATHPVRDHGPPTDLETETQQGRFLRPQRELNSVVVSVLQEPVPKGSEDRMRHLWLMRKKLSISACRQFAKRAPDGAVPAWVSSYLVGLAKEDDELVESVVYYMAEAGCTGTAAHLKRILPTLETESRFNALAGLVVLSPEARDTRRQFVGTLALMIKEARGSPQEEATLNTAAVWTSYVAAKTGDTEPSVVLWRTGIEHRDSAGRAEMLEQIVAQILDHGSEHPATALRFLGTLDDESLSEMLVHSVGLWNSVNTALILPYDIASAPPDQRNTASRLRNLLDKALRENRFERY